MFAGSADFVGVNHYTTVLISKSEKQHPSSSIEDDMGVEISHRMEWKTSQSSWLRVIYKELSFREIEEVGPKHANNVMSVILNIFL